MVVCVDESSKDDLSIYWHYRHSMASERAVINAQLVCREQWCILPALTVDGYIAACIVPGSVDGSKFFDFIVQDVVSVSFFM